ncbi:MAG: anti-sigma F factor [Lachnospiraceae bacterium]|nr:anti-sigma F factor [Lachnospiraceae bacterium]
MEIKMKKRTTNQMQLVFDAISENEQLARLAVAAFITPLDPTLEEMADVKTAISEAVTNAIIHGYEEDNGLVYIRCRIKGDLLEVEVEDKGKGIADIDQAMEPMYTTKPEQDRSGMGFSFMEAFMDELEVSSILGVGTTISMKKKLGTQSWLEL